MLCEQCDKKRATTQVCGIYVCAECKEKLSNPNKYRKGCRGINTKHGRVILCGVRGHLTKEHQQDIEQTITNLMSSPDPRV